MVLGVFPPSSFVPQPRGMGYSPSSRWWSDARSNWLQRAWKPIRLFVYHMNDELHTIEPGSQEWYWRGLCDCRPRDATGLKYFGELDARMDRVEYGMIRPWVLVSRFNVHWTPHAATILPEEDAVIARAMFEAILRSHYRVAEWWTDSPVGRMPTLQHRIQRVYWADVAVDASVLFALALLLRLTPKARSERRYEKAYHASRSRFCASCGYPRSGLPSATCPECGFTPRPDAGDSSR